MKFLTIFILPVIFLMACGGQNESSKTQGFDAANLQTIEIAVYGMTCSGCEKSVTIAVEKLPGVQYVKASALDSIAIVSYDKTKIDFEVMESTIKGRGYTVDGYRVID